MSDEQETCPGCGGPLPEKVMQSISHTINPGAGLCIECGQKETMHLGWALGRKVGWERHKAALKGQEAYEKYKSKGG